MGKLATPRSPEELTPTWLTDALTASGIISGAKVASVRTEGIGVGAGFIGQLARASLEYDRPSEGAPATLIGKFPALDPQSRYIGNLFRFYEREIAFYEEIASEIELRTPRRYYSQKDVAGDEYILLLEDLVNARCGDEVAGCTPEEAEIAIRGIAEFHATWWQSPRLDTLDWLPYVNAPVHQSAQQSYQEAWAPFVQMCGDRLTPKMRALGEAMQTRIIDLLNLFERPPRTMIHGDFRLDNVFFGNVNGEAPLAVIDWQISSRGRGIFDVAYFMCTSMDADQRKSSEMRLLHLWHDILVDRGVRGYSFDEALWDYRAAILYTNTYTVIALGSLDTGNERGVAAFNKWIERRFRAIEDLDAGELMPR